MSNEISMNQYVRIQQIHYEQERLASAIALACESIAGKVISQYVPPDMYEAAWERMKLDIKKYIENSYGVQL